MRIGDLRPGWRTDLTMHAVAATLQERDDYLVVRTPDNPTYYWGNCLVARDAPGDADLERWLARFASEIATLQPDSRHVAIGVNAPYAGEELPAWRAAGFDLHVNAVMRLLPGGL